MSVTVLVPRDGGVGELAGGLVAAYRGQHERRTVAVGLWQRERRLVVEALTPRGLIELSLWSAYGKGPS